MIHQAPATEQRKMAKEEARIELIRSTQTPIKEQEQE